MGTMWVDEQNAVYFYDKDRPDAVYCYDRYTGEKFKARIILNKEKIIKNVGQKLYDKYHHQYLLVAETQIKHLPREFMNYIRRESKNVKCDLYCHLGY